MSFYNQDSLGGSFVGFSSSDPLAIQNAGRLDFLESTIQTNGVDETNISGTLIVAGSNAIRDNLDIQGNVCINGVVDCDLVVQGNITANRVYFNGNNTNSYISAEEMTYIQNGTNSTTTTFYAEQSGNVNQRMVFTPVLMEESFIIENATTNITIQLESCRRSFLFNGAFPQTLNIKLIIPEDLTSFVPSLPVDHNFVIYRLAGAPQNTIVNLLPVDKQDNPISGYNWALYCFKKFNIAGNLYGSGSDIYTQQFEAFNENNWQGFFKLHIFSMKSPDGTGFVMNAEIYDK